MTVRELIEKLVELQTPNAEVVRSGSDHSYVRVSSAQEAKAEKIVDPSVRASERGHLVEYYDDENKSFPDSPVVDVVVVE